MKILNSAQIKEWDQYTIENTPVSSENLINIAAEKCVKWLINHFNVNYKFAIICGKGNNGGDGLVIARELLALNYQVDIYIINAFDNSSDDFNCQFSNILDCKLVDSIHDIDLLGDEVLIDAILGSGLTRNTDGIIKDVLNYINKLDCFVISIDIPSGFFAFDNTNVDENGIIKANVTLTFQQLKFSFLFADATPFIGDVYVFDIGLLPGFLDEVISNFYFVNQLGIKKKEKTFLQTGKIIPLTNINNKIDKSIIDIETKLLYTPVLNQSKRSLYNGKCLNRFETLHHDIQNPKHVISEFNRPGLGTRELYKKTLTTK